MDAFEKAAREEARRAWWDDGHRDAPHFPPLDFAAHMAVWARDHLAAQEPTDAEVEAARLAIHQALAPDWMAVANVLGADQAEYDSLLDSLARAALAAARNARQGN